MNINVCVIQNISKNVQDVVVISFVATRWQTSTESKVVGEKSFKKKKGLELLVKGLINSPLIN